MVLPLPIGSRDENSAVTFTDLSDVPDFFDQLARYIWLWEGPTIAPYGDEIILGGDDTPTRPPLKVHEVGAFDASFVPTLADFGRLDARFNLPATVWDALPQYRDYGFVVFKLRKTAGGLKGVHPMAFEFSTRLTNTLFLPTVHVHDGQVHPLAWFDHILYLQGQECDVGPRMVYYDNGRELSPSEQSEKKDALRHGRCEGWKFKRSEPPNANHFGVCVSAGPSEALREEAREMWSDVKELRQKLMLMEPSARPSMAQRNKFMICPIWDMDIDLYALGMSGMMPNADTLIRVEPLNATETPCASPAHGG